MVEPKNEEEFQALMEEVDALLVREQCSIDWRPLMAASILARHGIGLEVVYPLPDRLPTVGVYSGADLALRLRAWFDMRYGDRLLVDLSVGRMAVLLRGAAWLLRIPFLAGAFLLTTDPEKASTPDELTPGDDGPHTLNILEHIDHLPYALAKSLSQGERMYLDSTFRMAAVALRAVADQFRRQYVAEARLDLQSSADLLIGQYCHPGQSKWSSQQATEKMIKAYIRAAGHKVRRIHDVAELAMDATSCGLSGIPPALIDRVEALGDTRYGEVSVPLAEAVVAHHAAVELCGLVAVALKTLG